MLALRKYERDLCACGFPVSLTQDPANHFRIEERRCPVCADSERYARVVHDRDETHRQQHKDDPAGLPRPGDGRHIGLRVMPPQEVDELKARRAARHNRMTKNGGDQNGDSS